VAGNNLSRTVPACGAGELELHGVVVGGGVELEEVNSTILARPVRRRHVVHRAKGSLKTTHRTDIG